MKTHNILRKTLAFICIVVIFGSFSITRNIGQDKDQTILIEETLENEIAGTATYYVVWKSCYWYNNCQTHVIRCRDYGGQQCYPSWQYFCDEVC